MPVGRSQSCSQHISRTPFYLRWSVGNGLFLSFLLFFLTQRRRRWRRVSRRRRCGGPELQWREKPTKNQTSFTVVRFRWRCRHEEGAWPELIEFVAPDRIIPKCTALLSCVCVETDWRPDQRADETEETRRFGGGGGFRFIELLRRKSDAASSFFDRKAAVAAAQWLADPEWMQPNRNEKKKEPKPDQITDRKRGIFSELSLPEPNK